MVRPDCDNWLNGRHAKEVLGERAPWRSNGSKCLQVHTIDSKPPDLFEKRDASVSSDASDSGGRAGCRWMPELASRRRGRADSRAPGLAKAGCVSRASS